MLPPFPKGAACNLKSINRIGRRFDANTLHVITSIFQITARQAGSSSATLHKNQQLCCTLLKKCKKLSNFTKIWVCHLGSLHFKRRLPRKSHPNSKWKKKKNHYPKKDNSIHIWWPQNQRRSQLRPFLWPLFLFAAALDLSLLPTAPKPLSYAAHLL